MYTLIIDGGGFSATSIIRREFPTKLLLYEYVEAFAEKGSPALHAAAAWLADDNAKSTLYIPMYIRL